MSNKWSFYHDNIITQMYIFFKYQLRYYYKHNKPHIEIIQIQGYNINIWEMIIIMNKKILVILTGGTIGSSSKNGVISTDKEGCTAIQKYYERYGTDTEFVIVRLMNILSENLNKSHWGKIINYIIDTPLDSFDSVILTHGSDTLSYSSAMISMCLGGRISRPLFITAANYVPENPASNAVQNIRAAVVLTDIVKNGIFTLYANPDDKACSVFIPTRIMEADRFYGRFSSADGMPLGFVRDDVFTLNDTSVSLDDIQNFKYNADIKFPLSLEKDVLMIHPYPSMRYDMTDIDDNTGAVLHITYHSSTACSETSDSALSLIEKCRKKGIKLYLASFGKNNSIYESSYILVQKGAVPICHMSDEAAYAKLLLCCNSVCEPESFMSKQIYFENI